MTNRTRIHPVHWQSERAIVTQPKHLNGPGPRSAVQGRARTAHKDPLEALEFDTLVAAVRAAYHRDLAEATDDSDIREQLHKAETVVEQLAKLARSLVDGDIRESQYISRTLRIVGLAND